MENQNRRVHGSVTTHTDGFVLFVSHAKQIVGMFFLTSIFLLVVFYKYIYLIKILSCKLRFLDVSQTRWSFLFKHMCRVMTAKKGCSCSWIVELNTLWYVGFQPFFSLSYYFHDFFFLSRIHITTD
jgi:hypothetical protein